MSYPFPDDVRNPDRKGPNPFAEDHKDEAIEAVPADSPLGSSPHAPGYNPEFVPTTTNRATMIFWLGVVGLVLSVAGWIVYSGNAILLFMPVISLAFSLPAVFIGLIDRSEIRQGKRTDKHSTLLAIGIVGGLLGILNTAIFIGVGVIITGMLNF